VRPFCSTYGTEYLGRCHFGMEIETTLPISLIYLTLPPTSLYPNSLQSSPITTNPTHARQSGTRLSGSPRYLNHVMRSLNTGMLKVALVSAQASICKFFFVAYRSFRSWRCFYVCVLCKVRDRDILSCVITCLCLLKWKFGDRWVEED